MDEMEGHDFEYYCADLLKASGFLDVEVTKGSGDFGADILAEKDGITYAFQCKCYDKPIGVKAIQEIYAGRDYYDRMVGGVMTNQYFTQPAVELATKLIYGPEWYTASSFYGIGAILITWKRNKENRSKK